MTSAVKAPPPISTWTKITAISRVLFLIPPQILLNIVRCLLIASKRGLPLGPYALCGVVRVLIGKIPPQHMRFLTPSTLTMYTTWLPVRRNQLLKSKDVYLADRLTHDVQTLPDGASSLMWLGNRRTATKVVLFFHGGGYFASMTDAHLEWCLQAYVEVGRERSGDGEEVAVAVLQYELAPEAKYPTQLCQAVQGLAEVLRAGVKPRDLVMGGDSAGGNLTAQVLGHLLHPHPRAEAVTLDEPLAGVFAVSPMVSGSQESASFKQNRYIDMISPEVVAKSHERLLGGVDEYVAERDSGKGWAMVNEVDGSWLEGLKRVTRDVYVTVGAQEVLRDQGIEFAENLRVKNPGVRVKLQVMEKEAHDWILVEGMMKKDGDATRRMREWASGAFWKE